MLCDGPARCALGGIENQVNHCPVVSIGFLLCTLPGTSWAFISQIISSDLNEPIKHQDPFQLLLFAAVTGFTKPFQIIDVSHTFLR